MTSGDGSARISSELARIEEELRAAGAEPGPDAARMSDLARRREVLLVELENAKVTDDA